MQPDLDATLLYNTINVHIWQDVIKIIIFIFDTFCKRFVKSHLAYNAIQWHNLYNVNHKNVQVMFIILHSHQILTNPPRNEEESNYLRFFPVRENKGLKIYFEKFCAERSTRKRKEAAKKNKWRVEVSFARSESEIIWKSASRSFFTTALLVNFLKYLEINYNCSYTLWRGVN
jgi:hypothetical protein